MQVQVGAKTEGSLGLPGQQPSLVGELQPNERDAVSEEVACMSRMTPSVVLWPPYTCTLTHVHTSTLKSAFFFELLLSVYSGLR